MIVDKEFRIGSVEVKLYGLQFNQSVQSINDDVNLIKGKETLVRVFISGIDQPEPVNVEGVLKYTSASNENIELDSINSLRLEKDKIPSYEVSLDDLQQTLNFIIPPSHTENSDDQKYTLNYEFYLRIGAELQKVLCNECDFEKSHSLAIRLLRMRYLDKERNELYPAQSSIDRI